MNIKNAQKLIFVLITISFFSSIARGEVDVIKLSSLKESIDISSSIKVLEDPESNFDIQKVIARDNKFFKPKEEIANFGFSKSAWWAKFALENDLGAGQRIYIEYSYPAVDFVSLYYLLNGEYQSIHLGEYVKSEDDALFYRAPIFIIDVPPGVNTYHLRIKTEGSNQFPIKIWHPNHIMNHISQETAFVWMLYGFLLVMVFYNAFLYLTYRDKSFLIYVFYIFFSLLSHSGLQGWWKPFLGDISQYINEPFMVITCISTFFANYFTIAFLELKTRTNKLYKAHMIIQALVIINMFVSVFNYTGGALLYLLCVYASAILILTSGIYSSKMGFRPAYWFTLARFVMVAFAIPYLLSLLKILPLKAVTIWGGLTGIALEMVLISFALGDKMRYIQLSDEQKIKALNATLEQKVKQRTQQLAQKNSDLITAAKENKSLIRILCHDLNNTLSIIKFVSQRALKKISDLSKEKHIELLKKIEKAAATQEDIIEHVRSMELVSSGKIGLQLVPTSINKIIENGKFIFDEQLKQKSLSLNISSDFDSDVFVMADPVTLSNNVFNNLLSNSIKFSLPGKTIDIRIESLPDSTVQISIRDYGIGMPDYIKENVFLPDKQTSRTGTSGEKGTGFGMSLVKTYVDYYQGNITVESREQSSHPHDHGTKYLLSFKMAASEQAA